MEQGEGTGAERTHPTFPSKFTGTRLIRSSLWVSAGSGALLLSVLAFQWTLVDWLTVVLFLPLVWFADAISAVAAIFALVVLLVRVKTDGWRAAQPLAVQVAVFAVAATVPFTGITLALDFRMNRGDREKVIEMVRAGTLQPRRADLASIAILPADMRHVSKGGEILIAATGQHPTILFFTFRGVLSSFAGFAYCDDGNPPDDGAFLTRWREVVKYDEHWYWVSGSN
jgi:hypothetical protein